MLPAIPDSLYFALSAVLFTIGAIGVITRRNAIIIFMCIELMLNGVNIALSRPATCSTRSTAQYSSSSS